MGGAGPAAGPGDMGMSRVVEIRGLEDARAVLHPEIHERAHRRTINDLTLQSATASSRKIRERYTVKAGELKKKLRTRLLTAGSRVAKIRVEGRRLGLLAFAGTRQTKTGVSVKLKHQGRRKIIRHAFLREIKGGRQAWRRVWRRTHPAEPVRPMRPAAQYGAMPRLYRLPLEKVTTIGPAEMFDHPNVYAEIERVVDEKAREIYRRNYRYYAGA